MVKRGQQDTVEDNQEIDKKRKEIDRTAKGAEENFVESSIKQALIKPVQALGKKIRGPFDGFMKALESLFMGWLGLKGIDALEAWQKGDTEALEQIKNDLIKGLAVAAGIGLALNGGIGAVAGVISSLLTNMLFQLPKLIGLMANPWVWLGAAAVYGGIKLLEIMKNMGLSGQGRGSYESYTQEVIDMVGKIGKQKTIQELERRKKRLLQQKPWLNIPGAKQFTPQGALFLEIEQNIRSVQSGEFDRYDPTKVSAADKKIINDISSAIGSLAQYKRTYDQLTSQMNTLLGGKQVVELEPKDRAKYEQLQESHDRLFAQMKASMKYTQGLINDLSLEGRDFVEAKFGRAGNAEMFKSTGVDFPINIPGLPPFQLQAGDPDPTRLQNLQQIQTELNTIKPASQRVEASSEKATKAAANGLNETMQLTKQVNITLAENLAKESYEMPAFTFMPYSSQGMKELEPVASAALGTGYPTNFLTQNPYNAKNLIFSASVFETP